MRRALRALSVLVTGALLVVGTPAVHAAAAHHYRGGCGLDASTDPTQQIVNPDTFVGVLYASAVVYSDGAYANPVSATVTCTVKVNGVTRGTASFVGTVAVSGAAQTAFLATDSDITTVCTTVWFHGGGTVQDCAYTSDVTFPPYEVTDLLGFVDPTMCPILAALAPGVPGVVDIEADGDTYVAGGPFWNCPPYWSLRAEPEPEPGTNRGRHKHKDPGSDSGSTPLTPYYPSGSITMTQTLGGPVNYSLSPSLGSWTCTPSAQTMTSISCDPPAAPSGYYNVCRTVAVSAKSTAIGTVAGTSSCASGAFASAESIGPASSPSTNSASPNAEFPWTCAANPGSSLDWSVTCTVNIS